MEPTGKINVYVNGGSTGNSIETTVVQLTADALGADIEDVSTIQGDTAVTPYGAGTQGSRCGSDDGRSGQRGGHDPAQADRGDGRPRWASRKTNRAGRLESIREQRPGIPRA